MKYTLGLDMGVASLGWAVLSEKARFIDSGVRIFPAGIEKFGTGKDTHLNQERRKARTARRRIMRKAKRKELIRQLLTDLQWIPVDPVAVQAWKNLDVYELRSRALREKISLTEFARIMLHLNQRRGFLPLRKSELDAAEGEDKKKLDGMLGELKSLQNKINQTFTDPTQCTLGNYLHRLRRIKEAPTATFIASVVATSSAICSTTNSLSSGKSKASFIQSSPILSAMAHMDRRKIPHSWSNRFPARRMKPSSNSSASKT